MPIPAYAAVDSFRGARELDVPAFEVEGGDGIIVAEEVTAGLVVLPGISKLQTGN
jgi:hypothetical protein